MTMLTVQPGSFWGKYIWHDCHWILRNFRIMYVSHARNVCKSQNTMKPFFPWYKLINDEVLLVQSAVLVYIDKLSSFQDFLWFLECIYNPFKMVFKVTKCYVCKSPNMCAYDYKKMYSWIYLD